MEFEQNILLKNGKECLIRNGRKEDAKDYYTYMVLSHSETNYLTTYPDEVDPSLDRIEAKLMRMQDSPVDLELCAFIDGKLVGSAGIGQYKNRYKTRHRAILGISIIKEYWGLGIGSILIQYCIEQSRKIGYKQIELEVVGENQSAINLYLKYGFVEYGRNPMGFIDRNGHEQELVLMRLVL